MALLKISQEGVQEHAKQRLLKEVLNASGELRAIEVCFDNGHI